MTYEEPGLAHGTGRCVLTHHTRSPCTIFLTFHLLTPFLVSQLQGRSALFPLWMQWFSCRASVLQWNASAPEQALTVPGRSVDHAAGGTARLGLSTGGALCGPCSKKARQNPLPLSTSSANAALYHKQKPMGKRDQQLRTKNDLSAAERLVKELDKLHSGNFPWAHQRPEVITGNQIHWNSRKDKPVSGKMGCAGCVICGRGRQGL